MRPMRIAHVPGARWWLELGLLVLACAAVFLPDLLRLDRWAPFAQLVAFRPVLVAAGALAGMGLVPFRRTRRAGILLVLAAATGIVLLAPRATEDTVRAGSGDSLTVLSANVGGSAAELGRLADLIRRERPDVVVLPEASAAYRARLSEELPTGAYRGRSMRPGPSVVAATSLLVSRELGPVRFRTHPRATFGVLSVTGGQLGKTRVVAFHANPPLPLAGMDRWRHDLSLLRRWCNAGSPAIVAGDYNATLDHSVLRGAMRGCSDAAAARGAGLQGTWPSVWSRWLTPQIDHVLVSRSIVPRSVAFPDLAGSDHRAMLARVTLG